MSYQVYRFTDSILRILRVVCLLVGWTCWLIATQPAPCSIGGIFIKLPFLSLISIESSMFVALNCRVLYLIMLLHPHQIPAIETTKQIERLIIYH